MSKILKKASGFTFFLILFNKLDKIESISLTEKDLGLFANIEFIFVI